MSAPGPPDPLREWKFVEKLLAEDAPVPSAEYLLAKAEARAARKASNVASLPQRRRPPWTLWLVAAALAVVVGALGLVERGAIVAWMKGPAPVDIRPDDEKPRPPTPVEIATKLRDEAETACAGRFWGTCAARLDEAATLDPEGETSARVMGLRTQIHDIMQKPKGREKPVGPPRPVPGEAPTK
jgi:hypothetical protein